MVPSINQSIDCQSIDQSINQSIDRSINQSSYLSIKRAILPSLGIIFFNRAKDLMCILSFVCKRFSSLNVFTELYQMSKICDVSPTLEMYAKKMATIKRRVTVMHNILQNVQVCLIFEPLKSFLNVCLCLCFELCLHAGSTEEVGEHVQCKTYCSRSSCSDHGTGRASTSRWMTLRHESKYHLISRTRMYALSMFLNLLSGNFEAQVKGMPTLWCELLIHGDCCPFLMFYSWFIPFAYHSSVHFKFEGKSAIGSVIAKQKAVNAWNGTKKPTT